MISQIKPELGPKPRVVLNSRLYQVLPPPREDEGRLRPVGARPRLKDAASDRSLRVCLVSVSAGAVCPPGTPTASGSSPAVASPSRQDSSKLVTDKSGILSYFSD